MLPKTNFIKTPDLLTVENIIVMIISSKLQFFDGCRSVVDWIERLLLQQ